MRTQFIIALIIASVYRLWTEAAGFVTALRTKPEVTDSYAILRLATCRKCPLFYKPLQTCGSPLLEDKKGCYCHMPTKARTEANCWLYDQQGNDDSPAWPTALNSFPHGRE